MENTFFKQHGYMHVKGLYNDSALSAIRPILDKFHNNWLRENYLFYKTKAINSSGLTASPWLTENEKLSLFHFINSTQLLNQVTSIIARPRFLNSQLFFNPYNPEQHNYWHRDSQYHLDINAQQSALTGPEVLHCRIAFEDERGIELIPASHKNWDSEEELAVRLEQQGAHNYDSLSRGKTISLQKGDLLIFSANMIHRGLYGLNRISLDILFFERHESVEQFINTDFLPTDAQLKKLENPAVFI